MVGKERVRGRGEGWRVGERRGTGKEDGEKGGGSMWAELEEWGRWEDNRVGNGCC